MARPLQHATAIAAAFDHWARTARKGSPERRQRDGWARTIDPASNRWRDAIAGNDTKLLEGMLAEEKLSTLPPATIQLIARTLRNNGEYDAAVELLTEAQRLHPDDYWIHLNLAWAAGGVRDTQTGTLGNIGLELALRHATAAVAVRPKSLEARHWLGILVSAEPE